MKQQSDSRAADSARIVPVVPRSGGEREMNQHSDSLEAPTLRESFQLYLEAVASGK